jgi:hypothetical protein
MERPAFPCTEVLKLYFNNTGVKMEVNIPSVLGASFPTILYKLIPLEEPCILIISFNYFYGSYCYITYSQGILIPNGNIPLRLSMVKPGLYAMFTSGTSISFKKTPMRQTGYIVFFIPD